MLNQTRLLPLRLSAAHQTWLVLQWDQNDTEKDSFKYKVSFSSSLLICFHLVVNKEHSYTQSSYNICFTFLILGWRFTFILYFTKGEYNRQVKVIIVEFGFHVRWKLQKPFQSRKFRWLSLEGNRLKDIDGLALPNANCLLLSFNRYELLLTLICIINKLADIKVSQKSILYHNY